MNGGAFWYVGVRRGLQGGWCVVVQCAECKYQWEGVKGRGMGWVAEPIKIIDLDRCRVFRGRGRHRPWSVPRAIAVSG